MGEIAAAADARRARRRLGARALQPLGDDHASPRWRTAPTRCTVGTAIAYGVGRSPLTLAAEARDLDELSDGRLVLGLGNGTRRMIADWHGLDPEAPAVRMEELVPLLRRLWRMHEGPVDHEGRFYRLRIEPTGDLPPPLRERDPDLHRRASTRAWSRPPAGSPTGCSATRCSPSDYLEDVVLPAIEQGRASAGPRRRRRRSREPGHRRRSHEDRRAGAARGRGADRLLRLGEDLRAAARARRLRRRGRGDPRGVRARRPRRDGRRRPRPDGRRDRPRRRRRRRPARAAPLRGLLDHVDPLRPSFRSRAERARANAHALIAAFAEDRW